MIPTNEAHEDGLPPLPDVHGGGYSKQQLERMLTEYGRACIASAQVHSLPLMRAAFTTSVSSSNGYYLKFAFPTLTALQAAHNEWISAAMAHNGGPQ